MSFRKNRIESSHPVAGPSAPRKKNNQRGAMTHRYFIQYTDLIISLISAEGEINMGFHEEGRRPLKLIRSVSLIHNSL